MALGVKKLKSKLRALAVKLRKWADLLGGKTEINGTQDGPSPPLNPEPSEDRLSEGPPAPWLERIRNVHLNVPLPHLESEPKRESSGLQSEAAAPQFETVSKKHVLSPADLSPDRPQVRSGQPAPAEWGSKEPTFRGYQAEQGPTYP